MKIPEEWTFASAEVATHFDEHVRQQLPWYDDAQWVVSQFVRAFLPHQGRVYDLGCSTGAVLQASYGTFVSRDGEYIGLDSSAAMTSRFRKRELPGEVLVADVLTYDYQPFDIAVAFLTFSFLDPAKRGDLLRKLEEKVVEGGIIVLFDRFLVPQGCIGGIFRHMTLEGKLQAGVTPQDAVAKDRSLFGHYTPLTTLSGRPYWNRVWQFGEWQGWVYHRTPQL